MPSNVYYFYQDYEGSVTHVMDLSGGVTEKYRYDPFGVPTIIDGAGNIRGSSAIINRFMFTGREWSELGSRDIDGCAGRGNLRNERERMSQWAPVNLGFYEYRARAYHPGLGRFMSEDPKGFDAGDYNLYRYCGNNPEDRVDPSGMIAGIFSPSGDWAGIASNGYLDSGAQGAHGDGSSPKADQAGGGSDAGAAEVTALNPPDGGVKTDAYFTEHGPSNERGAPNSLRIVGGIYSDNKGIPTQNVQATHTNADGKTVTTVKSDIYTKEKLNVKTTGNIGPISTDNIRSSEKIWARQPGGLIKDNVSASAPKLGIDGKPLTGTIYVGQTYKAGLDNHRWYDVSTHLTHVHPFKDGMALPSSVIYGDPPRYAQ